MPSADDDRRLHGQEDLLADPQWRWARWWEHQKGWDHDHGELCWADISTLVGDHADADEGLDDAGAALPAQVRL